MNGWIIFQEGHVAFWVISFPAVFLKHHLATDLHICSGKKEKINKNINEMEFIKYAI